jgi:transposase-like protein
MYSTGRRRLAIETYIKFDPSAADTVAELGHPTRHSLGAWYKDYLEHGKVRPPKRQRGPSPPWRWSGLPWTAVSRTGRASPGPCAGWAIPPAGGASAIGPADPPPGQRKHRGPNPKAGPVPLGEKTRAVAEPGFRNGTAAEVAEKHGVSRAAPYIWRREMKGDNVGEPETKGEPVGKEFDDLPDDVEVLQDMLREAKVQLGKVRLELDVRQATLETAKKARAPTRSR